MPPRGPPAPPAAGPAARGLSDEGRKGLVLHSGSSMKSAAPPPPRPSKSSYPAGSSVCVSGTPSSYPARPPIQREGSPSYSEPAWLTRTASTSSPLSCDEVWRKKSRGGGEAPPRAGGGGRGDEPWGRGDPCPPRTRSPDMCAASRLLWLCAPAGLPGPSLSSGLPSTVSLPSSSHPLCWLSSPSPGE